MTPCAFAICGPRLTGFASSVCSDAGRLIFDENDPFPFNSHWYVWMSNGDFSPVGGLFDQSRHERDNFQTLACDIIGVSCRIHLRRVWYAQNFFQWLSLLQ